MRLTVPVLQTKLTPCAECVVRCEKALLTFWRDVHRRLSTWTLRHNVALKVLFFEILTSSLLTLLVLAGGAQSVVRVRKCSRILGFPVYAEHTFVWANRVYVDARFVDHNGMRLLRVEMSCPWLDNHKKKDFEKTEKYQPLWWELIKQYPDYKIVQLNVIGGSRSVFVCSVFQGSLLCDRPVSGNNRLVKIASQIFLIFLILKNKATAASFRRQKIHSPSQFPSLFLSSLESFSAKLGEHVALWFALTPSSLKWLTEKKNPKSLRSLQYAQRDITNFTAPYVAIFLSMYTL